MSCGWSPNRNLDVSATALVTANRNLDVSATDQPKVMNA